MEAAKPKENMQLSNSRTDIVKAMESSTTEMLDSGKGKVCITSVLLENPA